MTTVRSAICLTIALAGMLAAGGRAAAQDRGPTDGPEGSEIGKGGYQRPSGGDFSLGIDWGAATVSSRTTRDDIPLFVGLNAAWWLDDWFQVEGAGQYVLSTHDVNLLLGPRLRTGFWPFSLSAGLKAGAILVDSSTLRFGVSPQVGADVLVRDVLLGLNYALDVPVSESGVTHRIFMSIGYRF